MSYQQVNWKATPTREVHSPIPPKTSEFDANFVLGVPVVNSSNYWRIRLSLIEKYNRDKLLIKQEYDYRMARLYFEYTANSLKLSNDLKFNTEFICWKEGSGSRKNSDQGIKIDPEEQIQVQTQQDSVPPQDAEIDNEIEELEAITQPLQETTPESSSSSSNPTPTAKEINLFISGIRR